MTTDQRTAERGFISAPEPGGKESIVEAQSTSEQEMHAGSAIVVQNPTYVYLWNRDTRARSVFAMHTARAKMKEVFPWDHPRMAADFAWTSEQPSEPEWQGIAICPLHPNRPEREVYTERGYPVCDRVALPNEGDAQRHLQRKHGETYKLIKEAEEIERYESQHAATEKLNDRMLTLMEYLVKQQGGEVVTASVVESAKEETTSVWDFDGTEPVTSMATGTPGIELDVTLADITTYAGTSSEFTTSATPDKHAHQYPKAMGAKCKVKGCLEVRTTPFKARKKNAK